jgi:isomerase DpgB
MVTSLHELGNRTVVQLRIDGAAPLSSSLTKLLDSALDQAEDLGEAAVVLVHVTGHRNHPESLAWPGTTDIGSVNKWERVLRRCERATATIVVLAEDICSALALDLLMVADRRLANGDLVVQLAAPGADLWPGMALFRLANQVGYAHARKLLLFGTQLTRAQAMESAIVDATVDGMPGALEHVAQLLANSRGSDLAVRRRLMQDSLSTGFDDAFGAHLAACDRALRRGSAPSAAAEPNATRLSASQRPSS